MNIKSSIRPLGIIVVSLFGFLVIISQYADNSRFELTAQQMHDTVYDYDYTVDSLKMTKLDNPIVIDINEPTEFVARENVQNIPLSTILDEKHENLFNQSAPKVILSNDPVNAHEAWMLLTQLGYEGVFVME